MNYHFKLSKQAKRMIAIAPKEERGNLKRLMIAAESNTEPRAIMAHLVPKPKGYEGI